MKPKKWTAEDSSPPGPDPVKLLENLMKQQRLRAVDLAAQLGISKSHMSNILCYQRALSKEVIRKLAARFQVEQERFNRPYNLATQPKMAKPEDRTNQPYKDLPPKTQKDPPPKTKKGPRDTAILELLQRRTGIPTTARMKNGSLITIWNIMPSYFMGAQYAFITTNVKPTIAGEKPDVCFTSDITELIDPATGSSLGSDSPPPAPTAPDRPPPPQ
jgi:plasmid maintenance system antidote protein VapI